MSRNNIFYIVSFIVGFVLCFLLLNKCDGDYGKDPKGSRTVVIERDTVWPDPVFKTIVRPGRDYYILDSVFVPFADTSLCRYIRAYNDTISDSSLVVIISDSIQGKLRNRGFSYKLKVPLKIYEKTTIIDSIPYAVPFQAVYATGGINSLGGFLVGADYQSKQRWGAGYYFNTSNKSHNVLFRYRIFKK